MNFKVFYKANEVAEFATYEESINYIVLLLKVDKEIDKNDFSIYRKLYPL